MNEKSKNVKRRWWLAGLLSYILPGLGQVYNGQPLKGLFFNFIFTLWGGIVFTMTFYAVKQDMTGFKIALLFLVLLISLAAHLFVIIESILTARKKDLEYQPKFYNKWYIYLAVIVVTLMIDQSVAMAIKENVIKPYTIASGSMEPSLLVGDFILSNQIYFSTHNPERGDIILFKYPVDEKTDFIKRIIGVPGDMVEIRNKNVWINNKKLIEPYVQHSDSTVFTQLLFCHGRRSGRFTGQPALWYSQTASDQRQIEFHLLLNGWHDSSMETLRQIVFRASQSNWEDY